MIVWGLRIAAIPLAIILYVVLIRNFYKSDPYAGQSHEFSYPPFEPLTGSLSQRVLGVAISHASQHRRTTTAKGTSFTFIGQPISNSRFSRRTGKLQRRSCRVVRDSNSHIDRVYNHNDWHEHLSIEEGPFESDSFTFFCIPTDLIACVEHSGALNTLLYTTCCIIPVQDTSDNLTCVSPDALECQACFLLTASPLSPVY